jgi:hypothetical protein
MGHAMRHRADVPSPTLRLQLLLWRDAPSGPWRAEVALPGASGRLAFASPDALFGDLSRLDRPPGGLR